MIRMDKNDCQFPSIRQYPTNISISERESCVVLIVDYDNKKQDEVIFKNTRKKSCYVRIEYSYDMIQVYKLSNCNTFEGVIQYLCQSYGHINHRCISSIKIHTRRFPFDIFKYQIFRLISYLDVRVNYDDSKNIYQFIKSIDQSIQLKLSFGKKIIGQMRELNIVDNQMESIGIYGYPISMNDINMKIRRWYEDDTINYKHIKIELRSYNVDSDMIIDNLPVKQIDQKGEKYELIRSDGTIGRISIPKSRYQCFRFKFTTTPPMIETFDWLNLPIDMKMMVAGYFDIRTRCRFGQCSKESNMIAIRTNRTYPYKVVIDKRSADNINCMYYYNTCPSRIIEYRKVNDKDCYVEVRRMSRRNDNVLKRETIEGVDIYEGMIRWMKDDFKYYHKDTSDCRRTQLQVEGGRWFPSGIRDIRYFRDIDKIECTVTQQNIRDVSKYLDCVDTETFVEVKQFSIPRLYRMNTFQRLHHISIKSGLRDKDIINSNANILKYEGTVTHDTMNKRIKRWYDNININYQHFKLFNTTDGVVHYIDDIFRDIPYIVYNDPIGNHKIYEITRMDGKVATLICHTCSVTFTVKRNY